MKRIIVVGSTSERAIEKLREIRDSLDEIKLYQRSRLVMLDGTEYIALWLNEQTKGLRWDCAYIDRCVSLETLNTVIFPMSKYASEIHWY